MPWSAGSGREGRLAQGGASACFTLGPFPLLLALYLQFRGWKWGEWGAVFDVGWVGALLIFGLTLLYLLGWMLIGQRIRLDSYVAAASICIPLTGCIAPFRVKARAYATADMAPPGKPDSPQPSAPPQ